MLPKITTFLHTHRLESTAILSILLLGAFLRLWRISSYMTFLGDEGRDARVVYRLLTDFDIILVGPMTSVLTDAGHMFLGPAYYYLMAPAMALAGLSPVGPAVMVAIFSVATIAMIWWFSRQWFTPGVGLIAALLYAISPTVITYSHSSWNPNIMPFFALLGIWSIYQVWHYHRYTWLIITGLCVAMILQSHYLGLLILPTYALFWFLTILKKNSSKSTSSTTLAIPWTSYKLEFPKSFNRHTFLAILIVLLSFAPLVIFDARHNWINTKAMYAFFTVRQTTVNLKVYKGLDQLPLILEQIFTSLLTAKQILYSRISLLFIILTIGLYFIRKPRGSYIPALLLLLVWLGFGLLGLSLYKQTIFDHYFGFLFPLPHILIAFTLHQLWARDQAWDLCLGCYQVRRIFAALLLIALIFINLANTPIRYAPNQQFLRTTEISQKIIAESGGQPFNLALLAKSNYDESYRFILEHDHAQLTPIEPQNPDSITHQLFVVCENPDLPESPEDQRCAPIGHPQSEIALFGWAKIEQQWDFPWGHKLYKLVHLTPAELQELQGDNVNDSQ